MDNNSFSCQFSGFFGQVSIISSFINCGILIWIMREFLLKGDATQFNSKQIYQYSAISFGISIGLSLIPLFDGDFVGIYLPWDCSFDLQGLNGVLYTIFFELIPFTLLLIYAIIVHKQIRIKISQRQQGEYFSISELRQQGKVLIYYTSSCFFTWFWVMLFDFISMVSEGQESDQENLGNDLNGWIIFRIIAYAIFQLTGFFIAVLYFRFVKKEYSLHYVKRFKHDSFVSEDIEKVEPLIKPKELGESDLENFQLPIDIDPEYNNQQVIIMHEKKPKEKKKIKQPNKKKLKKINESKYKQTDSSSQKNGNSSNSQRQEQLLSNSNILSSDDRNFYKTQMQKDNYRDFESQYSDAEEYEEVAQDLKKRKGKINPLAKFKDQIQYKDMQ